jgi:hypothetical protein
MSIATLKRKTQAQYNNNSVGFANFSLNGTLRSQGYVGQTSLSRSLPRTLMNGPTPRGHGGCCGNYPMHSIIQSAVTSLNDPHVIKSSVINTTGMINEKLNNITNINETYFISCGPKHNCYNTVKPDYNQHLNHQGNYITNKAKTVINKTELLCNKHIDNSKKRCSTTCKNKDPFFYKGPAYNTYTKPLPKPMTQGQYLILLDNSCNALDIKNIPNTQIKKTPLPGPPASF